MERNQRRVLLASCFILVLLLPATLARKLTGDEPHYLLIAHSLVVDRDLDLRNNYLGRHYAGFYPDDLADRHVKAGRHGEWYPVHDIGLPLLIAPWYRLGGHRLALLSLLPIALLLALNVYRLGREISGDERIAFWAWATVFPTAPVLLYAFQLFPETVAAVLLVYAFRILRSGADRGPGAVFTAALGLGYLPWLHMRYALPAAVLAVFFLLRNHDHRRLPLFLAPLVVSALLNIGYYAHLFRQPLFRAGFHEEFRLTATGTLGLAGLLFDGQAGLLIYSPVYVLALAGLPLLWRRDRTAFLMMVAAFSGAWLLAGAYPVWYGGWCPQPARYLVAVLPLLGPAAACTCVGSRHGWLRFCRGLWVASLAFPLLYALEPRATYTGVFAWWLKDRLGLDLSLVVPTLTRKQLGFATFEPTTDWPLLFWCLLAGSAAYLLRRHATRGTGRS